MRVPKGKQADWWKMCWRVSCYGNHTIFGGNVCDYLNSEVYISILISSLVPRMCVCVCILISSPLSPTHIFLPSPFIPHNHHTLTQSQLWRHYFLTVQQGTLYGQRPLPVQKSRLQMSMSLLWYSNRISLVCENQVPWATFEAKVCLWRWQQQVSVPSVFRYDGYWSYLVPKGLLRTQQQHTVQVSAVVKGLT